jgi:hypothetical protein
MKVGWFTPSLTVIYLNHFKLLSPYNCCLWMIACERAREEKGRDGETRPGTGQGEQNGEERRGRKDGREREGEQRSALTVHTHKVVR